MNAGALRHVIQVQDKTVTRGEYGEAIDAWATVLRANANVEPLRGKEFIEGVASQSQITHKIRLRYRSGIQPTMRVLFCGRYLEIMYVIDVGERKRELNLYCKEVFTDG